MNKANILLVDDQPGKLLSYQSILDDLGENLVLARSGREALQQLLRLDFALILLDVVMPEMDGFETATLIRQHPRLEDTPIIFLTAFSTSDLDRLKGYTLGAVDYVFAPVVPEVLRAKVMVFVELHRKRQELAAINDLMRAEIAERTQAEERFRVLLEAAPDAMVIIDRNGVITMVNSRTVEVFGYERRELIGQPVEMLVPEAARGRHVEHRARYFADPRARPMGSGMDLQGIRKDGTKFPVEIGLSPLQTPEGMLVYGAIRDISERQFIETRLRQSERLAAIGEMVTGLAHESRNALQLMQASLEMLARRLGQGPEQELVQEIQHAQDRLHHLFGEVGGYAAPIRFACEDRELAGLWREAWRQLSTRAQSREACLLERIGSTDLHCRVDPFSMERVFRNVLENSLAACPDPVEIEIQCSDARLGNRAAVRVLIRDNGPGLTAEQRQKIFVPFYTTKARGIGLGMPIAKRIVEAHGGRIAVDAGPCAGATIEITLPRSGKGV